MQARLCYLAAFTLVVLIGCSSMSSTMLTRDEGNNFWTRKGGLKGVPITLKVPTHVQLTVFERYFMVDDGKGCTYRLKLPYAVRDFSQEFLYSEKIFTVDFKRPAAGSYDLNLDLTDDQYIQKLQHDVTDNTIDQVSALVKSLMPNGLRAQTASGLEKHYYEIQSVVAVGMFEIDAPDFEEQMTAFVNCHLNQAHDAWVVPPGVTSVHRAHLIAGQASLNVYEGPAVPGCAPAAESPVPESPVPETVVRETVVPELVVPEPIVLDPLTNPTE